MSASLERRAKEVFEQALALPEDRRLDFVSASCAGTPGLEDEVRRLLRFDGEECQRLDPVASHPNEQRLATADRNWRVSIWSVESGERLASFDRTAQVFDVAWGPTGRVLASALESGLLELEDAGADR